MDVREKLMELADTDYRKFHSGLIPGNESPILGVRLPHMRKLAGEIAKGDFRKFLSESPEEYYEEVMLKGLVIGRASMDTEERFSYIRQFVPKIKNWAVCDCFVSGLKFTEKNKEAMWEFLKGYLTSEEEYSIRFGVVMLLDYFAEEEYAEQVFSYFNAIHHEGYYVKMAVAWAVSVYFVKMPEITMNYLNNNRLDDWTYNKALQKITESYRVDQETKKVIRGMKRRNWNRMV